jgi:hypothetical protein
MSYLTVAFCASCVQRATPQYDPTFWAYSPPDPQVGCWVCGTTTEHLALMSLKLSELSADDGAWHVASLGDQGPVLRSSFGYPMVSPGKREEEEQDEE